MHKVVHDQKLFQTIGLFLEIWFESNRVREASTEMSLCQIQPVRTWYKMDNSTQKLRMSEY